MTTTTEVHIVRGTYHEGVYLNGELAVRVAGKLQLAHVLSALKGRPAVFCWPIEFDEPLDFRWPSVASKEDI